MGVPKTSDHIQINICMQNPNQEPPVSSKAPNEDLKDTCVLCTFKIKIVSQNSDHGYVKDKWPYSNQSQDAKLKSGTFSVLTSPKSNLEGHEYYRVLILKIGLSEVKVSLEVISMTAKLYWAF